MSIEARPRPILAGLINAEGGAAHQVIDASDANPVLRASIVQYQGVLARIIARLTSFDKVMIVIAVGLATSMEVGITTAVNVILPDMQGNVGASADQISWVVTVYSAAFLSALPINTSLARLLGHRNHLLLALLLYAAGAAGCFASRDLSELLTARAVMGFGGGAFLARSQATIYRLFQGKQRGKYLASWGFLLCLSKALMPFAFGFIADRAVWNDAFLLALPIALASAALLYLFMPDRLELLQDQVKPDHLAAVLLVAGIASFQVFISRGEQDNWLSSRGLDFALVVAIIGVAGFVTRDLRRNNPNPLLHLRILATQHSLSRGLGIAFILGAVLGSGLYLLPQYLRTIQTYSAAQTGLFFTVDGFATLGGVVLSGILMPRWNIRAILLFALTLFLIGNAGFVHLLTPDTPGWVIASLLLFHGVSIGLLLVGVGSFVLGAVDLRLISFGTSIYLFFRQLGTAIGVTAAVVLIDQRESLHSARLLSTANRLDPALRMFRSALGGYFSHRRFGFGAGRAAEAFSGQVTVQAKLLSFIDVFWALQIVAILAALLLLPGSSLLSSWMQAGRKYLRVHRA